MRLRTFLLFPLLALIACGGPPPVLYHTSGPDASGQRLRLGDQGPGPAVQSPVLPPLEPAIALLMEGRFAAAAKALEEHAAGENRAVARDAARLLSPLYNLLEDFGGLDELFRDHSWLLEEHWIHDVRRTFATALAGASPGSLVFGSEPQSVPTRQRRFKAPQLSTGLVGPAGEVQGWLWLDTTAALTAISSTLAEKIGVIPIGEEITELRLDSGRRIPARPGILPRLQLGHLEVHNLPIAILDSDAISFKVAGITLFSLDGLIGAPLLRELRLLVDYSGGQTEVERTHGPGNLNPSLVWIGNPLARVGHENGEGLWFQLATAADRSLVHPGRADLLGITEPKIDTLALDVDEDRVELLQTPVENWTSFTALATEDGRLSSGLLDQGILVVDFQSGTFGWRRNQPQ